MFVKRRRRPETLVQQVSELLPVKGIDYLGPLPADIQEITVFAAAVHKAAGPTTPRGHS